jgi:hypothetical protein
MTDSNPLPPEPVQEVPVPSGISPEAKTGCGCVAALLVIVPALIQWWQLAMAVWKSLYDRF